MISRKIRFLPILLLYSLVTPTFSQDAHYDKLRIIVKVKEGQYPAINQLLQRLHPGLAIKPALKSFNKGRARLKNYYMIEVVSDSQGKELSNKLKTINGIESVEFKKVYKPLGIPNDPAAQPGGIQWILQKISAYNAWNLLPQAPAEVITAIIDTGFDLNHEDLAANIAVNYNDPINGIDDDNDGYIDNYNGWDFGDGDNDPYTLSQPHGTQVSGAGFAVVNNSLGIAGVSYNQKFLPIKIYNTANDILANEFDAIIYAAEHGAKVINLSWGATGEFSQFEQDIIDYVTLDLDAVIIAAAGNTNAQLDFYPASYKYVLSAGAILQSDLKPSWATYSDKIDLVAPGQDVYTTQPSNGYGNVWGSSFASPVTAATAALVRSIFPQLNSQQVIEKIRIAADDIYSIPGNEIYFGKLGKGRLNMEKALQNNPGPSIRAELVSFPTNIYNGDTLKFTARFKNFLDQSGNVTINLKSLSSNAIVLTSAFDITTLNTLEATSPYEFEVLVGKAAPPDEFLELHFEFDSNNYQDFQMLPFRTSPDYIQFNNYTITWTFNSKGEVGYFGNGYTNGEGFRISGIELASNAGLIIGTDANHIASTSINDFSLLTKDDDFLPSVFIKPLNNPFADLEYGTTFIEKNSWHYQGVQVSEKILGWTSPADQQYLIVRYRISNITSAIIKDLKVGIYTDWDLENYQQNKTAFDVTSSLGYVASSNLVAGISLLTGQPVFCRGVDLGSFNGNAADLTQIFDYSMKAQFLNDGTTTTDAGTLGNGNDVALLFGGVIDSLKINESQVVSFVIGIGNSLSDLQMNVAEAQVMYDEYEMNPTLLETLSTCYDRPVIIDPVSIDTFNLYQDIELQNLIYQGNHFVSNNLTIPAEYFIAPVENGIEGDPQFIRVNIETFNPVIASQSDTIIISPGEKARFFLNDISSGSISRNWDFGNGYFSTLNAPVAEYFEAGTYNIILEAMNQNGCVGFSSRPVSVLQRYPKPDIVSSLTICKGDSVSINDQNKILNIYSSLSEPPIMTGTTIAIPSIIRDTVFYITQTGNQPESPPVSLSIKVDRVLTGFTYSSDTLNINSSQLLNLKNSFPDFNCTWYVNGLYRSSGSNFQYNYSQDSSLYITQISESPNGCKDSLNYEIVMSKSPAPENQVIYVCDGTDYTIRPSIGNILGFYSDGDLKNLLHKGSTFSLVNLHEDTIIYAVNLDSLLPSAPAAFQIFIDHPNSHFTPQFDTLLFPYQNEIQFHPEDITMTGYSWRFGVNETSTEREPVFIILEPGLYSVELVVTDPLGCSSSQTGQIDILDLTAIDDGPSEITLYPNPVTGDMVKLSTKEDFQVRVLSYDGRQINVRILHGNDGYIIYFPEGTKGNFIIQAISSSKILVGKVFIIP